MNIVQTSKKLCMLRQHKVCNRKTGKWRVLVKGKINMFKMCFRLQITVKTRILPGEKEDYLSQPKRKTTEDIGFLEDSGLKRHNKTR